MQTTFAEIPAALWERVERWIPKHSKSRRAVRPQPSAMFWGIDCEARRS